MPAKKSLIVNRKSSIVKTKLSIPVYSLIGTKSGVLSLPEEIFGAKLNKSLLSQAVRVYTTNQKVFTNSVKTRGQVEGSTVKIFRQKGTGRARHGSVRAPIFVGGGIVFGPQIRKVRLDLPKKMKKAALISALSDKASNDNVIGLTGVEKATGKTKEMFRLLNKIGKTGKKMRSALIMTDGKSDNVVRAVRNIAGINVISSGLVNAYEVLKHDLLFVTKEAIEALQSKPEQSKDETKAGKAQK